MTSDHRTAIVTPSYALDFDRCRLLCDSIDRFVEERVDHYLLVDNDDHPLFSQLAGSNRHVINELDILPEWLHSARQGFSANARKFWYSTRTWPMRGWHVQQLRRIAIAHHVHHEGLLYCDSDMLFVRPFSMKQLWHGSSLRLYRKPDGINNEVMNKGAMHKNWTQIAAQLNGLKSPAFPAADYINNLVSWRRRHVIDMCARIEEVTGRDWVAAIGAFRTFSECQIYGAYADDVLGTTGHWHADAGLCLTYWNGEALSRSSIERFVDEMEDDQVAIGIQSFTDTKPEELRYLLTA